MGVGGVGGGTGVGGGGVGGVGDGAPHHFALFPELHGPRQLASESHPGLLLQRPQLLQSGLQLYPQALHVPVGEGGGGVGGVGGVGGNGDGPSVVPMSPTRMSEKVARYWPAGPASEVVDLQGPAFV